VKRGEEGLWFIMLVSSTEGAGREACQKGRTIRNAYTHLHGRTPRWILGVGRASTLYTTENFVSERASFEVSRPLLSLVAECTGPSVGNTIQFIH
jgi:hypothetical protein